MIIMSCLSTARKAELTADLADVNARIIKARTAYLSALDNIEVESYSTNTGEGSQSTRRRSPEEIQKLITSLIAERDRITKKLNGTGLVNLNLRRIR